MKTKENLKEDEILDMARKIKNRRSQQYLYSLIRSLPFALVMIGFGAFITWFIFHSPTNLTSVGVCNFPISWIHYLNSTQLAGCYFKP